MEERAGERRHSRDRLPGWVVAGLRPAVKRLLLTLYELAGFLRFKLARLRTTATSSAGATGFEIWV
jgi:hypothetical protein